MLTYMADIESKLMAWGLSADQLVLNERGAWSLGLANGPVIELGTDTTESRLERALKVYQGLQADAQAAVERLDARYTNGVSVRWKELEVASGYQYSGNPVHQ
jgi:cell division protein FtsQ